MTVKGPWMRRLGEYVQAADPSAIDDLIGKWQASERLFRDSGESLKRAGVVAEDGFSASSLSGQAARRNMEASGNKTADKSDVIKAAVTALQDVRGKISMAMREHARLEGKLPDSHGAAPDASDPKYAQAGAGVDAAKATENRRALQSDQAAFEAREAAIAEAERIAAQHVQDVDNSVDDAEPKVRALYDDGSTSDPVPAGSSAAPGSYSDVAAAQARMDKYNAGTMYPGGWGQDLKAEERANIEAYKAENRPEWDGNQWVNADGSPAPATSYAMVETADGLAPLAGGSGGMSALAVAGGGALLGAGVAKAVASKFGAGAAKAATPGATSRSASAAKAAAARAGTAGARAGTAGASNRAAGAGARGTGAGSRGAGASGGRGARGGPAGAGSRAGGRAGAGSRGGAGAGGRRGGKKDDQQNGQGQDWQADYTDDWTDPNYKATPTVIGDEWKRRAQENDE